MFEIIQSDECADKAKNSHKIDKIKYIDSSKKYFIMQISPSIS